MRIGVSRDRILTFPVVPYSDPAMQAEFKRDYYLRRYQEDPEFRADEAFRKKEWYDRNKKKLLASYRAKRKKMRASLRRVKSDSRKKAA
jgi:hypothetical protein